jgi:hypothetical protein
LRLVGKLRHEPVVLMMASGDQLITSEFCGGKVIESSDKNLVPVVVLAPQLPARCHSLKSKETSAESSDASVPVLDGPVEKRHRVRENSSRADATRAA